MNKLLRKAMTILPDAMYIKLKYWFQKITQFKKSKNI